jgi:hypothetical protein
LQHQQRHTAVRRNTSASMNLNGQDWNEVVIRKKKPTSGQLKDEAAVNAVSLVVCGRTSSADGVMASAALHANCGSGLPRCCAAHRLAVLVWVWRP